MGCAESKVEEEEQNYTESADYVSVVNLRSSMDETRGNEIDDVASCKCCHDTSLSSTMIEIAVRSISQPSDHYERCYYSAPESQMSASDLERSSLQGRLLLCDVLELTLSSLLNRRLRQAFNAWYNRYPPRFSAIIKNRIIERQKREEEVEKIGAMLKEEEDNNNKHIRHAVHNSSTDKRHSFDKMKALFGKRALKNRSKDWQALANSFPWNTEQDGLLLLQKVIAKLGTDDEFIEPDPYTKKTLLWHAVLKNDIVGVNAICEAVKESDLHPEDVLEWLHLKDCETKLTPAELAHKRFYTVISHTIEQMVTQYESEYKHLHKNTVKSLSSFEKIVHKARRTTIDKHTQKKLEAEERRVKQIKSAEAMNVRRNIYRGLSGLLIRREHADTSTNTYVSV